MTNYGLGGLCEVHVDPHGMMETESLPKSREYLKYTGKVQADHDFSFNVKNCCKIQPERLARPGKLAGNSERARGI